MGSTQQGKRWDHIINREHQQALHRQNVQDPTSALPFVDSPIELEPLDRVLADSSPWRESDDDYARDDNNNLVPWSWRAKEAANFAAQTNTVNELERKANLKCFRMQKKYADREAAARVAKEMEEDQCNKVAKGLGKGSTKDIEEEHCSKFAKGLGKGSTASSSKEQSDDLPISSPGFPGVHWGPLPSTVFHWWEQEDEVNAKMWPGT